MDIQDVAIKIKHFIPFIFGKFEQSGYKLMDSDNRDFKYSSLVGGGSPYIPKKDNLSLDVLSVKNQLHFNDCVYNSIVGSKEPDEGIVLSVESIVAYANRQGYISGNGFSDLRSGQKSLSDFGCQEQSSFPNEQLIINNNDWASYVGVPLNTVLAAVHKSKTFWFIHTRDEVLSLLDQGRYIALAIPWYSGYNNGGIINKTLGYYIGGHCIFARGYKKTGPNKYNIILHNSYSENWGDNGDFYMDLDFLVSQFNNIGYGATVNLDLDSDLGGFLNKYDGQDIRSSLNPNIYHIQGGKKKLYPDMITFLAWTGGNNKFIQLNDIDSAVLNKVPNGDNMDITKTVYWPVLQTLSFPDNLTKLLEILHKK